MHRALEKILEKTEQPELVELLSDQISNGELTTLLLEVYKRRAEQIRPSQLLLSLNQNRFVHPPLVDPIQLRQAELKVFELAVADGFTPVELSPVAPLGTSAAYGKVSQNNVLTALRGCEVVSDPSNLMALLMAEQLSGKETLHWICSHRTLRTSQIQGPGMMPHFQMLAACSLVRTMAPEVTIETALQHLHLQQKILAHFGFGTLQLKLQLKSKRKFLGERMLSHLQRNGFEVEVIEDAGTDYYEGFQLKTWAAAAGGSIELADCGFVSWLRELKSDAALNCFISGIGLERLMLNLEQAA